MEKSKKIKTQKIISAIGIEIGSRIDEFSRVLRNKLLQKLTTATSGRSNNSEGVLSLDEPVYKWSNRRFRRWAGSPSETWST